MFLIVDHNTVTSAVLIYLYWLKIKLTQIKYNGCVWSSSVHNKAAYFSASSGTSSAVGESANGDGEREGKGAKFFEDRKEKAHSHKQNGKRVLLLLLSSTLQGNPVLIIQF